MSVEVDSGRRVNLVIPKTLWYRGNRYQLTTAFSECMFCVHRIYREYLQAHANHWAGQLQSSMLSRRKKAALLIGP